MQIPASVTIGANVLKAYAVGDTIEDRFRNVLKHVDEGCWLTVNQDERFRAAVGGVLLSYPVDSPEFHRIEAEMQRMQQVSAMLRAAACGLTVSAPEASDHEPIGLLGIWHAAGE